MMKFITLAFCVCLSFFFHANPTFAAKKVAQKTKPAKIFLTATELKHLNIEDRVDYLLTMTSYWATYERIQDKILSEQGKKNAKSAYLERIQNFLDLLPAAQAQMGQNCYCGTYPGAVSGGKCSPIGVSQACGASKFTCKENIYSIPNGNGTNEPICVSKGGSCGDRSTACAEALKAKLEAMTDSTRVLAWAKKAAAGVTTVRMADPSNAGVTVEAHCAQKTNDRDCQTLNELADLAAAKGAQVQSSEQAIAAKAAEYASGNPANPHGAKGLGVEEPLIPMDGPFPQAPSGCEGKYASLGALACVACGLEAADPAIASGGASEFVALMGVVSQTYRGPHATQTATGRQKLQEDVINRLVNYGYCSDQEFGSGAMSNSASAGNIRAIIDGDQKVKTGWFIFKRTNYDVLNPALEAFGFQARTKWGTQAYSNQMFGNRDGVASYSQNQQQNFSNLASGMYQSYPNTKFSRCAKAILNRNYKRKESNICQPQPKNTAEGWLFDDSRMSANDRLNDSIRSACGMGVKKKSIWNRTCQPDCYNLAGRPKAWLWDCPDEKDRDRRQPRGKGGERERPRPERPEPETPRDKSYGNEKSSTPGPGSRPDSAAPSVK